MGTYKKVALLGGILLIVSAGILLLLLSWDRHDSSKDKVSITPPPGDGASKAGLAESRSTGGMEVAAEGIGGRGRGGLESDLRMEDSKAMASPVELAVGSRIDLTLSDQFDEPTSISEDTETLILALSKDAGDTVRFYLDEQDADFLPERKAVFIADFSPIPVIVRNLALRTLKKRSYKTLLIYDSDMAASLKSPGLTEEISIISLQENEVTAIRNITTRDELDAILNDSEESDDAKGSASASAASAEEAVPASATRAESPDASLPE